MIPLIHVVVDVLVLRINIVVAIYYFYCPFPRISATRVPTPERAADGQGTTLNPAMRPGVRCGPPAPLKHFSALEIHQKHVRLACRRTGQGKCRRTVPYARSACRRTAPHARSACRRTPPHARSACRRTPPYARSASRKPISTRNLFRARGDHHPTCRLSCMHDKTTDWQASRTAHRKTTSRAIDDARSLSERPARTTLATICWCLARPFTAMLPRRKVPLSAGCRSVDRQRFSGS